METSSGISWEISSGVSEYVRKHMMTCDVLESNIKGKYSVKTLFPIISNTHLAFNRKLKVVYIEP